MGKPTDPDYWRRWRAAHPEYVERQRQLRAERRRQQGRGDRSKEYARRASRSEEPIPALYPETQHGKVMAFWEDELRLDLAQEAALAELEGRDPVKAVKAYRARETSWRHHTCPFPDDEDRSSRPAA